MAGGAQFSVAPALVNGEVVDVSTGKGAEIYKGAIAALPTTFDCKTPSLRTFLAELYDWLLLYGWTHILNVPVGQPPVQTSLLFSYGAILYDAVLAHVDTYIAKSTRQAQDSQWLYHCIMGSLSRSGKIKVIMHSGMYIRGDAPSGALLLKVIIQETCVDSNATTRQL